MNQNAKAIAFLCWIDCLERFDVLIEELRNIQHNIAFQLKSEPLYFINIYEEAFLGADYEFFATAYKHWGGEQLAYAIMPDFPAPSLLKTISLEAKLLKTNAPPGDETSIKKLSDNCLGILTKLNDKSVLKNNWKNSKQYSLLNKLLEPSGTFITPDEIKKEVSRQSERSNVEDFIQDKSKSEELDLVMLSGTITLSLFQFWQATFWSLDQRQLYYNLRASQALKRSIFLDKLFLVQKGVSAFLENSPDNSEKIYEVLTLRRALLVKCETYIGKLSAHQACVAESIDHDEQEFAKPLIKRRRDQALYSRILNDLCANTFQDMAELISACGEDGFKKNRDISLIHRWDHQYTSEYNSLYDHKSKVTHAYFKTSYWMPDRPDLQSAIIHEVGHVFTDDVFDNFSGKYFQNSNSEFALLFRKLKNLLWAYQIDSDGLFSIDMVLKEMGVDLLASSVKGSSYLYVQALEILGEGLELMYGPTVESFSMKQLTPPEGFLFSPSKHHWHFRLHLTCRWIELIEGKNQSSLTKKLIDGVRNLADGLVKQVEAWTNYNHSEGDDGRPTWHYHKDLKEGLCRTVSGSFLPVTIRKYQKKKLKDQSRLDATTKASHSFSNMAQTFLFNGLLGHKNRFWKNRDKKNYTLEDAKDIFLKDYGITIKLSKDKKCFEKLNVFNHLHDISWQCALMKGIDFVGISRIKKSVAFTLTHPALGRGVYQAAVDFFYHETENTLYHLAETVRMLGDLDNDEMTIKESPMKILHNQLNSPDSLREKSEKLRKEYEIAQNSTADQLKILLKTTELLKSVSSILDASPDVHLFKIRAELKYLHKKSTPLNSTKYIKKVAAKVLKKHGDHEFAFRLKKIITGECAYSEAKSDYNYNHSDFCFEQEFITTFIGSIDEYLQDSWTIDICQMHSFLNCLYKSKTSSYKLLCSAMSQHSFCSDIRNFDPKANGGASIWSLNKITTSHLHKIPADLTKGVGCKVDPSKKIMSTISVFGKYDFMSITEERFPSQARIGELDIFHSGAFPFFVRKESVIPICLSNINPIKEDCAATNTVAIICVKLNRSTWRLHFLIRHLDAYKEINELLDSDVNKRGPCCDLAIGSLLQAQDKIYLSDGPSDIVFEIKGDPGERFQDVLDLKSSLFDDFQTSLVETLPSSTMLPIAAERDDMSISILLKIRQSRSLERGLRTVKNKIKNELSEVPFKLYSVHGKMDIKIVFQYLGLNDSLENLIASLKKACGDKISRIQVTLEHKLKESS
ncbi:MAG: hypothetical protein BA863_06060 [Desulfovibrio sp. S3730MH75]|nr:MAG: hypothetical protein BA863_06060 [Desulfovibrio sp. S3730MH75]